MWMNEVEQKKNLFIGIWFDDEETENAIKGNIQCQYHTTWADKSEKLVPLLTISSATLYSTHTLGFPINRFGCLVKESQRRPGIMSTMSKKIYSEKLKNERGADDIWSNELCNIKMMTIRTIIQLVATSHFFNTDIIQRFCIFLLGVITISGICVCVCCLLH